MNYRPNFVRLLGITVATGTGILLQQGVAHATEYNSENTASNNEQQVASEDRLTQLEGKYHADAKAVKKFGHAEKLAKKSSFDSAKKATKTTTPATTEYQTPVETKCPAYANDRIVSYNFTINGVSGFKTMKGNVKSGDVVKVDFVIAENCGPTEVSFASYEAPTPYFDAKIADKQVLFDSQTGLFSAGAHSMEVKVPNCYYQTDFAVGSVLTKLGPEGSKNFYGQRLVNSGEGGTDCKATPPQVDPPVVDEPEVPDTEVPEVIEPEVPETPEVPEIVEEEPVIEHVVTPEEELVEETEVLSEEVTRTVTTTQSSTTVRQLAYTGVDSAQLAALGGALLLMGVAFQRAGSRVRRYLH